MMPMMQQMMQGGMMQGGQGGMMQGQGGMTQGGGMTNMPMLGLKHSASGRCVPLGGIGRIRSGADPYLSSV
jgi:hypothetical protein